MGKKIIAFTFFTLFLFITVSGGRIPVNPPATKYPSRESQSSAGSHILLPGEKPKSDSDDATANHPLPEPEKRTNFSRFHPINRHFHSRTHRRPYRKSVTQNRVPRSKSVDRTENDDLFRETFHGGVRSQCEKMKRNYGSRRHHNQPRSNNDDVIQTKIVFDREKLKRLMRQHRQKRSEEKFGFMKNIRKFLKHTFD